MKNFTLFVAIVFVLTACNFPSNESGTPTASTTGNTGFTLTPVPRPPPRAPSSTPSLLLATPIDQPVNCRSGPGTSFTVIGELSPGKQAEVIGKSTDVTWWYVKNPSDPSINCWLSADFVTVEGNVELIPVANPPGVTVTAVQVSVEPSFMNVACDGFPQLVTINVEISVSGPSTVLWRWEELSTGDISDSQSVLFTEGGTRTVQDSYLVRSARDYTMLVRILQPNEAIGRTTFKAVCTP